MIEAILADKRAEVAKLRPELVRNVRPSGRDLAYAIGTGRQGMALIAALKRRDPFDGDIATDLAAAAARFQDIGIGALVVATESRYWGGSREDLVELDRRVQVPLVRHDYIIEELQLFESRRAGADAVVLRPRLVPQDVLRSFVRTLASMHAQAVMLVRDRADLDAALATDATIFAVANRDPETGAADVGATLALAPHVPPTRSLVAWGGIRTAEDVARLRGRVDALCLGTSLLRAADPVAFLRELAGAGRD